MFDHIKYLRHFCGINDIAFTIKFIKFNMYVTVYVFRYLINVLICMYFCSDDFSIKLLSNYVYRV